MLTLLALGRGGVTTATSHMGYGGVVQIYNIFFEKWTIWLCCSIVVYKIYLVVERKVKLYYTNIWSKNIFIIMARIKKMRKR